MRITDLTCAALGNNVIVRVATDEGIRGQRDVVNTGVIDIRNGCSPYHGSCRIIVQRGSQSVGPSQRRARPTIVRGPGASAPAPPRRARPGAAPLQGPVRVAAPLGQARTRGVRGPRVP